MATPPALAELHDAAAFYTLKANVELGLAFVAEFERTANLVLDTGAYSRRINIQHRIVYEVFTKEKKVRVLRMWTHYE